MKKAALLACSLLMFVGVRVEAQIALSPDVGQIFGCTLADGVSQGQAGPREFRTAPLWGIGQRLFFLHDGRTSDLLQAIREHASEGSEANGVVRNFGNLRESQKRGSSGCADTSPDRHWCWNG